MHKKSDLKNESFNTSIVWNIDFLFFLFYYSSFFIAFWNIHIEQ